MGDYQGQAEPLSVLNADGCRPATSGLQWPAGTDGADNSFSVLCRQGPTQTNDLWRGASIYCQEGRIREGIMKGQFGLSAWAAVFAVAATFASASTAAEAPKSIRIGYAI